MTEVKIRKENFDYSVLVFCFCKFILPPTPFLNSRMNFVESMMKVNMIEICLKQTTTSTKNIIIVSNSLFCSNSSISII